VVNINSDKGLTKWEFNIGRGVYGMFGILLTNLTNTAGFV